MVTLQMSKSEGFDWGFVPAGTALETPEKNSSVAVVLNENLQHLKIRQKIGISVEKKF